MNFPGSAKALAALDDRLDRGSINPVKKWWWDIELDRATGRYVRARQTHVRGLQKDLSLKYEEQTRGSPGRPDAAALSGGLPVNREEASAATARC